MSRKSKRTPYLSHYIAKPESGNIVAFNGRLAKRTIDDPFDGTQRAAVANVRADVLGRLWAAGRIKHHQFQVGRKLEGEFEVIGYGGGWSDHKQSASNFVAHARRVLGDSAFRLVEWLLRDRHSIEQVAGAMKCDARFVVVRLREALEKLATASGHAGQGQFRKTPKDKHLAAAQAVERGERGMKAAA
jgi:hypothetical protein